MDKYKSKVKEVFIPDEPSECKYKFFVAYDYSQLEVRCQAITTKDSNLIKLLASGEDIHEETAKIIFDKSAVTAEERRVGKTVRLMLQYGAGARRVAEELGMSSKSALRYVTQFKRAFPEAEEYYEDLTEKVEANKGTYVTPWGRVLIIPERTAPWGSDASYSYAAIRNYENQALGADITHIAAGKLHKLMYTDAFTHPWAELWSPANWVHDEFLFSVGSSDLDTFVKMNYAIVNVLEQEVVRHLEHYYGMEVPVDLPVSIKLGRTYGTMDGTLDDLDELKKET